MLWLLLPPIQPHTNLPSGAEGEQGGVYRTRFFGHTFTLRGQAHFE